MDRDVVEGNSTSLESSARFPDPHAPLALMDISHMHMDDLGLTPSPGFQLQGHTSQDEKHSRSYEHEPLDSTGGSDGLNQGSSGEASEGPTAGPQMQKPDRLDAQTYNINLSEDSHDPLFDSTLPELDSVFSPKRTADVNDGLPPEKRPRLDSPNETPSLTTDSTHESPASFFETFDSLFGGGFDLPLVLPDDAVPDFEEPAIQPSFDLSLSASTKNRFSLDEQDILTNTTREILQVRKEPEYASPYPISGGPLGYLPSTPGIHVRCVAMGEELKDRQIMSLRAKVTQLKRERDYFKKSLLQYANMDGSGKTPEQLVREENANLRRVSSRHQARAEKYRKEATEWKNKLQVLSTIYNNLLYEVGVEKRIPSITPVSEAYKPPRVPKPLQGQLSGHVAYGYYTPAPLPISQAPVQSVQPGQAHGGTSQNITAPPNPAPKAHSVTIDLTDDEVPPTPVPAAGEREQTVATLESLRNKKYNWLQAGHDHNTARTRRPSPGITDDELAQLMEEELSRP
ncbi:uncharacterized protein BJX67DRAFT_341661 [Aspergillus lucknowensis]|uniref:BZIP domain-containing protein n=1 Tax=Aspergillus lucknowensis TaxID=176173 RepID=A0ABR4M6D7_9EURO